MISLVWMLTSAWMRPPEIRLIEQYLKVAHFIVGAQNELAGHLVKLFQLFYITQIFRRVGKFIHKRLTLVLQQFTLTVDDEICRVTPDAPEVAEVSANTER
ncbi:hypothetical protein FisN_30Hu001 [Fistulifera solaris]|jgi:hypothetical protein|uniref:Uncharacterized protein n=1 Tax=Fistulifera solaris TaxID=1519565 RepID=A0A1Z5K692_FISSO|nr:hypothetical protein FisN_30Hu001 [Fistulifera solaris]|eukprot:GAX21803.1 hypothetical protein FisN_30Hu001 [Fistulifera solaris]